MPVRIKDILGLEDLRDFQCLTNYSGLNNIVTSVGILDHEIIEGNYKVFNAGEFILSTLSVIRESPELVFDSIKSLIKQKVSGIAIKAIYYSNLSSEIIDFANKNHFPIFLFHDVFIESLIRSITTSLNFQSKYEMVEKKLKVILNSQENTADAHTISKEINPNFKLYQQVFSIRLEETYSREILFLHLDKFHRQNYKKKDSLFILDNNLLAIITTDESEKGYENLKEFLKTAEIVTDKTTIGESLRNRPLSDLGISIKESLIALRTAISKGCNKLNYRDCGISKLLIPLERDFWTIKYTNEMIRPLVEYDKKYKSHLYETISFYFQMNCNTKKVAEKLDIHKNTINYRLNKIKDMIGPFDSDMDFFRQISIALYIFEHSQSGGWNSVVHKR